MSITDELVPYEILIRFGDDGAPRGAHVQYRRVVTYGGEVLKDELQPAAPLGLEDFPTSALLQEVTATALGRIEVLEAELAEAKAEVARLTQDAP